MSINDLIRKINVFFNQKRGDDLVIILIVILTASASFALGILSERAGEESEIRVIGGDTTSLLLDEENVVVVPERDPGGYVVASKNGTKYHFPWCSGAQSIKESNKVWFKSFEEARLAGYTPASNCKGLE